MPPTFPANPAALRLYRNTKLYRPLMRTLRVYNRRLVAEVRARGFIDFSPAFPQLLSNLDMDGTRIGVLAARAGMSRQAAGQLLREIERCGFIERRDSHEDARATTVYFSAKGKRMLATVFELVEDIEGEFARLLEPGEFDRVRDGLNRIAEAIDPGGALGEGDRSEDQATSKRSHVTRSITKTRMSSK